MNDIQTLSFSINNWGHLYSLQQAIMHNEQSTGRTLSIHGRLLNQPFLNNKDTDITIHFTQADKTPRYTSNNQDQFVLGEIIYTQGRLHTDITVDRMVFEELRKNLMEYADIDGIHIIVSLGIETSDNAWPENQGYNLLQLDYAMKGDA